MTYVELFKQYLQHLFSGKRAEARELIAAALDRGTPAEKIVVNVIWPAMEQIEKLYRANRISLVSEHMATRINRMIADILHAVLPREPKNGKRMIVVCGDGEGEELGAQMTADLFEAQGWSVWFVGSGVPEDELLKLCGQTTPDVLTLYGAKPQAVPVIRKMIAYIRDVGICPEMQVMVSGGVFNRADGLADEVKADLFAPSAAEAVETVEAHPVREIKPDVPEPGRRRKRKKSTAGKSSARGASTASKLRKQRTAAA